jgi:hypothetical protein
MLENLWIIIYQIYMSDRLVWTVAICMGLLAAYILHYYIEDLMFAFVAAISMFVAIMITNLSFVMLGVMWTSDKNANVVAAAGAAMCSLTLIVVLVMRLWNAIWDYSNGLRGEG